MGRWPWTLAGVLGATWLALRSLWPSPVVLRATVWRPSDPEFQWPELDTSSDIGKYLAGRGDFGVAIAGGGERGVSLGHGIVRSLHQAGILKRARYMTTTSGSVWMSLPLYYQTRDTLDQFLGESFPPEKLTPELLTGPSMGSGMANLTHFHRYPPNREPNLTDAEYRDGRQEFMATQDEGRTAVFAFEKFRECVKHYGWCACLVQNIIPDSSLQELYLQATGWFFMQPFGLMSRGSYQCHESELEAVSKQLGSGRVVYAARDMAQNLPFPIFQTAIIAPYTGHGNDTLVSFPLEHTPLYTGTPVNYSGHRAHPYSGIGDVLVSSYAWPGEALDPFPAGPKSEIRVRKRATLADTGELAQAAGIATAYVADFQARDWGRHLPDCVVALFEKVLPHAGIWSPLHTDGNGVPVTQNLPVGDAGIHDDVGHIPLLRRGVTKMLIYTSAAVHDDLSGKDQPDLCQMTYTIAAFGQPGCGHFPKPAGASQAGMAPGSMTVFEPSQFAPFWDAVREKFAAGEPCVYRNNFTVVDNAFLGIRGGWEVDIIWVVLLPSDTWRKQLPSDTAPLLSTNFPNFLAGEPKYRIVLGALSQYSSWVTDNLVLGELKKMLGAERQGLEDEDEVAVRQPLPAEKPGVAEKQPEQPFIGTFHRLHV